MSLASFFPTIVRSKQYAKKANGEYYVYSHYRNQISQECESRCVYCDILIAEAGGEGCALDHFRPQEKFPGLRNDPNNLVISCSKCNRYKSNHWPISIQVQHSHDGKVGFIDPFLTNRLQYFNVGIDGVLVPLQGPSDYIIRLLNLNRPSRIAVRKKRILDARIGELLQVAMANLEEIEPAIRNNSCSEEDFNKFMLARQAVAQIMSIRASPL